MQEWYFIITQSMLELGLRGTELAVFAILNGFSQGGNGCYYGTRRTLAERCGVTSLMTVDKALHTLIEKGMIERLNITISGEEKIGYAACPKFVQDIQKIVTPIQNLDTPYTKNIQGEYTKNVYNKNKDIENKDNNKPPFIPPTKEQVSDYAAQRGYIDPGGFAAHFIDYYAQAEHPWHQSNGKPIKDWKRAVITWEPGNKYRHFGPGQGQRSRYGATQGTAVDNLLAMGAELYGYKTDYDEQ